MNQVIYYIAFIVYLVLTLAMALLKQSEIVLLRMQHKSTKLLKGKWKKSKTSFTAKCCILASALYANPKAFVYIKCFQRVKLINAQSYLGETRNMGFIANCSIRGKKFDMIALRSTVCIDDLLCTQDSSIVYTKYGQIHRGYYKQAKNILRAIPTTAKNVMITGHSLGGSLAIVIGFILSTDPNKNVSVYTFGSPRVGDTFFCKKVMHRTNFKVHNTVNLDDKICHIPLKYDRVGTVKEINYNTGSYIKNHSIYSYLRISNEETAELAFKSSYSEKLLFRFIRFFV
jgi:triacylglycerol lipase